MIASAIVLPISFSFKDSTTWCLAKKWCQTTSSNRKLQKFNSFLVCSNCLLNLFRFVIHGHLAGGRRWSKSAPMPGIGVGCSARCGYWWLVLLGIPVVVRSGGMAAPVRLGIPKRCALWDDFSGISMDQVSSCWQLCTKISTCLSVLHKQIAISTSESKQQDPWLKHFDPPRIYMERELCCPEKCQGSAGGSPVVWNADLVHTRILSSMSLMVGNVGWLIGWLVEVGCLVGWWLWTRITIKINKPCVLKFHGTTLSLVIVWILFGLRQ